MKKITGSEALKSLERAVTQKGLNYIYPGAKKQQCVYFNNNNKPSCIVGYAFDYLGVDPKLLSYSDNTSRVVVLSNVKMTDKAIRIFDAAQTAQDCGHSWGQALANARAARRPN